MYCDTSLQYLKFTGKNLILHTIHLYSLNTSLETLETQKIMTYIHYPGFRFQIFCNMQMSFLHISMAKDTWLLTWLSFKRFQQIMFAVKGISLQSLHTTRTPTPQSMLHALQHFF